MFIGRYNKFHIHGTLFSKGMDPNLRKPKAKAICSSNASFNWASPIDTSSYFSLSLPLFPIPFSTKSDYDFIPPESWQLGKAKHCITTMGYTESISPSIFVLLSSFSSAFKGGSSRFGEPTVSFAAAIRNDQY